MEFNHFNQSADGVTDSDQSDVLTFKKSMPLPPIGVKDNQSSEEQHFAVKMDE